MFPYQGLGLSVFQSLGTRREKEVGWTSSLPRQYFAKIAKEGMKLRCEMWLKDWSILGQKTSNKPEAPDQKGDELQHVQDVTDDGNNETSMLSARSRSMLSARSRPLLSPLSISQSTTTWDER